MKPKLIFLTGPTAVGKTAVAAGIARKINAEIISCDSMQVYKGMDIITSKPSAALRRRIKHHLVGVVRADRDYNAYTYRRDALKAVKRIIKAGKIPVFAGGTGLYISVVVDGIFGDAPVNKNIRRKLCEQAEREGSAVLHARLKKVDPRAAAKIHPNDTKRIIRALEVFVSCGKPISRMQKERRGLTEKYDIRIFCLDMSRQELYRRIEARVEKMFRHGLVKEVKRLLKGGLSKTAACAIGLKEVKGYLDGAYSLGQAKEMMKKNTRHYAKRQLSWFRKDKRVQWIQIGDGENASSLAQRIEGELWKKY